jgi:hypothetical protein
MPCKYPGDIRVAAEFFHEERSSCQFTVINALGAAQSTTSDHRGQRTGQQS